MPERWAFAVLFISTLTYTMTDIARKAARAMDERASLARRRRQSATGPAARRDFRDHAHQVRK